MLFLQSLIFADYIMVYPPARENPKGPYKGIQRQTPNKQQESNLTNQQDEFNENDDKGGRVPLWPCRAAPPMATPNVFQRGQSLKVEYQSNNQHAGYMEWNIFTNQGKFVRQVYGPKAAGKGFQRGGTQITIPADLPRCTKADGCFLQFYFYSKEPRNYVTCADFVLAGDDGMTAIGATTTELSAIPQEATATTTELSLLTKRQLGTATTAAPKGMKAVRPYDDAAFYEKYSTNYEMYAGQADDANIPKTATVMWNLTEPAEVGSKSTLSDAEKNKRQNFRSTIVKLTQEGESVFRCYQQDTERPALAAQSKGIKMMENKGAEDQNGYFPPAISSAYTAKLNLKPTIFDSYKGNAKDAPMQILSDPQGREDTTTYIDLPDQCLDAVYASVKTMQAGGSDLDTERSKIRTTCSTMLAQMGINCPGDTQTEAQKKAAEDAAKAKQGNQNKSTTTAPEAAQILAAPQSPIDNALPAAYSQMAGVAEAPKSAVNSELVAAPVPSVAPEAAITAPVTPYGQEVPLSTAVTQSDIPAEATVPASQYVKEAPLNAIPVSSSLAANDIAEPAMATIPAAPYANEAPLKLVAPAMTTSPAAEPAAANKPINTMPAYAESPKETIPVVSAAQATIAPTSPKAEPAIATAPTAPVKVAEAPPTPKAEPAIATAVTAPVKVAEAPPTPKTEPAKATAVTAPAQATVAPPAPKAEPASSKPTASTAPAQATVAPPAPKSEPSPAPKAEPQKEVAAAASATSPKDEPKPKY